MPRGDWPTRRFGKVIAAATSSSTGAPCRHSSTCEASSCRWRVAGTQPRDSTCASASCRYVSNPPDLSIVVPLKDEEQNVTPLYEELVSVLEHDGAPYEIILIDDGSIDATFARAAELHHRNPRVRVVRFTRNFGQTAAFAAGFAAARGRFIVTLDGDLQNDPADIPRLLQLAPDHDIVCGWRRNRSDDLLTRKLPSMTAN